MTSLQATALPTLAPTRAKVGQWSLLRPMRRYAVAVVLLFLLLAAGVWVRLQVQQLEIDLDRNDRAQRAATVLNERLELELRARRRLHAVQGYAVQLDATPETPRVRVRSAR